MASVTSMPWTTASRASNRVVAVGRKHAAAVSVAAILIAVAWWNGFYGTVARTGFGVVTWWALALVVATSLVPFVRTSRLAAVALVCFAAFVVWTGVSAAWAADAEGAHTELTRASIYLGVLLFGVLVGAHGRLRRWVAGIAAGLVGVALVAFASRVYPSPFPDRGTSTFLADSAARLSFPVGYWNGLAILLALAVPLLLAFGQTAETTFLRSIALAAVPLVWVDIYLSSSRGGIVVAVAGALAFVAVTAERWQALALLATSGLASVAAVLVVSRQRAFVDGPLGTDEAAAQGHRAALAVAIVCAVTALVAVPLVRRTFPRPPSAFGWALGGAAAVAAVATLVVSHPIRHFQTFKQPPSATSYDRGNFSADHLLSSAGNGRWQFWAAAVDEWRAHPVRGGGAGSFESWWTANGSISYAVKDAHSLYLQVLGELGIVGLALLVASVGLGIVAGARRALRAQGTDRVAAAALVAVAVGWAVGAGIDWMWQLTVVSVVGLFALGIAIGAPPATRSAPRATRLGIPLLAVLAIVLEAGALFAAVRLDDSRAAAARGDIPAARAAAQSAKDVEPWAATPYLQLALVSEQAGRLRTAERWLADAIERNPNDWTLRVVDVRLRVKLGDIAGARRALAAARRLNPRSPVLGGS